MPTLIVEPHVSARGLEEYLMGGLTDTCRHDPDWLILPRFVHVCIEYLADLTPQARSVDAMYPFPDLAIKYPPHEIQAIEKAGGHHYDGH